MPGPTCQICSRYNVEQQTEMAALLAEGLSWEDVAEACNVPMPSLRRHVQHATVTVADLRERGLRRRSTTPPPTKVIEQKRQEILATGEMFTAEQGIQELIALKRYAMGVLLRLEEGGDDRGALVGVNALRLVVNDLITGADKLKPAVEVETVDSAEIREQLESLIEAKIQAGILAGINGG